MPLPIDSVDSLKSAISDALGGGGTLIKTSELLFGQAAQNEDLWLDLDSQSAKIISYVQ